jgi:hypothetical protein
VEADAHRLGGIEGPYRRVTQSGQRPLRALTPLEVVPTHTNLCSHITRMPVVHEHVGLKPLAVVERHLVTVDAANPGLGDAS